MRAESGELSSTLTAIVNRRQGLDLTLNRAGPECCMYHSKSSGKLRCAQRSVGTTASDVMKSVESTSEGDMNQDQLQNEPTVKDNGQLKNKMSTLNRYVQSLCGLYSRIARQLQVDRSYVSRVARGERRSPQIEQALSTEFTRIMNDNESQTTS